VSINGVNRRRVTNFVQVSLLEIRWLSATLVSAMYHCQGLPSYLLTEKNPSTKQLTLVVSQGPRMRCISPLKFIYA